MSKYKIINTSTGEIRADFNPGDRILKKESIDYLINTVEVNKGEQFTKVYTKTTSIMAECLTGAENQLINHLTQYIRYNSYVLAYANGAIVTRAKLARDMGMSSRT